MSTVLANLAFSHTERWHLYLALSQDDEKLVEDLFK